MADMSIREYLAFYEANLSELKATKSLQLNIKMGFYDWFCDDKSLTSKTIKLTNKLKQVLAAAGDSIDIDKHYVFFKNNCPCNGSLYDDFRICDLESGDVIYTIVPACGHNNTKQKVARGELSGTANVWGKENDFNEALIEGNWTEVLAFFRQKARAKK